MFAVTGGMPTASSVGNVISVPEPTTALIVPAPTPAIRTAAISSALTYGAVGGNASASAGFSTEPRPSRALPTSLGMIHSLLL